MNNEKKYYVYEHRRLDTGAVFYVGKGKGNRAFVKKNRNKFWINTAKKYGFSTHMLYEFLSQDDANYLEMKIISAYGRENLCNLTDGGDGLRNPSKESRELMKIAATGRPGYWLGKKRDAETVAKTTEKLLGREGLRGSKSPLFGKKLSDERKKQNSEYMKNRGPFTLGHRKKISDAKTGSNHHMFDSSKYVFENDDGSIFCGTQFDFRRKFSLNQSAVRRMVIGERKSKLNGWSLRGDAR